MSRFDYIHVALHGHFDNKLAVKFLFNGSEEGTPRWEGSLPDPEAIVRNFVSARECYVMWHNTMGHYFGVIAGDPFDPRAGKVMVTLMVGDGDAVAGRAVFSALSALKKAFLEDRRLSADAVTQVLSSVGFPEKPMQLPSWRHNADGATPAKPLCYRTYLSTRELETVFSFPDQAEYRRYNYVVVITATASLRPGVAVDRITTPVKKVYSVICPEGVSPSSDVVAEGDHLTLTFNRDGFNPRKETITVGTPNAYTRPDGPALIVKSPGESGMGFTRKVRVGVRNAKGGLVNGYTMSVNDRPVNTMEPYIELTEQDLQPGRKVELQVVSNNFQPLKKTFDAEELMSEKQLDLVLVPVEQGILLKLDFGEGRIFEQHISIEKNTPEYSQLHSGNFHGFRAHRHAGQDEVYNVDVRAAGKPVTPSFANVSGRDDERAERKRVVPQFAKATVDTDRPVIERPAIEKASDDSASHHASITEKLHGKKEQADTDNEAKPSEPDGGTSTSTKIACIAVCAIAIIIGAIYIIKPLLDDSAESQAPSTAVEAAGTVTPAATPAPQSAIPQASATPEGAPQQPAAASADYQADIAYLNGNRSWKRDDLKSDEARALFDAIAGGNIRETVSHDYFAVKGRATNKDAVNVADMIWAANGTPTQRSNEVAMKKAAKKGSVNMWDLYEAVARVKPAEPNATPRPQR